ncbi:glycine betaine/L-proline ABC transporter ATP-binding protein [Paracoccus sp. (in: a-proteobacteria)]|uniref:quaternary amine ABC transporter ATP-binding protein n=1 Tax=Paracoccus sp. TaxID=267 RepID=UPI0028968C63|nr:glycine betaine/L-proline ABC transporter ATP-binding protein [Paracoccus sp. (in: a-proteobacteria)]
MAEEKTGAAIEIRHLYKIFGATPAAMVERVRAGLSKTELNKQFGHVLGLNDINLSIPAGSIQVVMGLSGSGKSTLIRHINRLIDPTAGEVLVDGTDVVKMNKEELRQFRRHQTAMVFQKFALLPHRTVLANTVYGLEVQGMAKREREDIAMRWIERVGLKGYENHYPSQLSGGMQQRVGLARALSNDAPILLMDEAYSALDPLIRVDMQSVLLDLQKEIRKTIVFITHDLDEALRLGDQIAILRDGEMIQQGTSQDIVLRPADEYVSNFVKEVNRGKVVQTRALAEAIGDPAQWPSHTILESDTLEMAARQFSQTGTERVTVVAQDGRPLGVLTMKRMLEAMVLH